MNSSSECPISIRRTLGWIWLCWQKASNSEISRNGSRRGSSKNKRSFSYGSYIRNVSSNRSFCRRPKNVRYASRKRFRRTSSSRQTCIRSSYYYNGLIRNRSIVCKPNSMNLKSCFYRDLRDRRTYLLSRISCKRRRTWPGWSKQPKWRSSMPTKSLSICSWNLRTIRKHTTYLAQTRMHWRCVSGTARSDWALTPIDITVR